MLALLFILPGICHAQEPAAKPIAEDWDYVAPMKKVAATFRGKEGVVIHVGGSMTIANPYGTWARGGKGKTPADVAVLKWMHTDAKDKTDGWWLCRMEVVPYRLHRRERLEVGHAFARRQTRSARPGKDAR